MAIKDIIVFFVESAIMLIPAITDAILALGKGDIGGVAKAIEFGLAKLITLVIGLLARLIGLKGLAKRVQKIFKREALLRKARHSSEQRKYIDKVRGKILYFLFKYLYPSFHVKIRLFA